jgi:hypothetical protein
LDPISQDTSRYTDRHRNQRPTGQEHPMSHAYPIWNEVEACNYTASKSWGSKNTMFLNQFVGSSASNSHHMAEISTTRRTRLDEDGNKVIVFRLSVDNVCIKEKVFSTNRHDRADTPISTRTKLNRIKSF